MNAEILEYGKLFVLKFTNNLPKQFNHETFSSASIVLDHVTFDNSYFSSQQKALAKKSENLPQLSQRSILFDNIFEGILRY